MVSTRLSFSSALSTGASQTPHYPRGPPSQPQGRTSQGAFEKDTCTYSQRQILLAWDRARDKHRLLKDHQGVPWSGLTCSPTSSPAQLEEGSLPRWAAIPGPQGFYSVWPTSLNLILLVISLSGPSTQRVLMRGAECL